MKKVILTKFRHRDREQLGLQFRYDEEIKTHVEKLSEVRWSTTYRLYYVPFSTQNKKKVYQHLRKKQFFVDYSALQGKKTAKPKRFEKRTLSDSHKQTLGDYVKYLKGLRLSESTVKTYYTFVADFFDFLPEKPLAKIDNTDVRLFTEFIVAKKRYSISSHRQLISAIKHFSDFCKESQIENPELKRPSKSKYLPSVLSQREVIDLLRVTANLKHRAVLALIYSAGLRVGEAINLKLSHIDIDRRQLFTKLPSAKDRWV